MNTNANKGYRPISAGRDFKNLQRECSDVFETAVKPVSSPNRLQTVFIAATVITVVGLVITIWAAIVLTTKSQDQVNKTNAPLGVKGPQLPTSTQPTTVTTSGLDTTSSTQPTTVTNSGLDTTSSTQPTTITTSGLETTSSTPPTTVTTLGLETTTTAPVATGTWNNWGSWTSCGATCGTGYHTRYRTCFRTSTSDPICEGDYVETTTCTVATCPVYGIWTTWSGWAVCDVTCGGGSQLRTRVCQKSSSSDLDCVGSSSQSQTCNTWSCPDCSQTCTTGVLNTDCTACECTSNTVQGIVRNHVNVPLNEASIAHAGVPYKTLATTNDTGGFVLDTTCEAVEIVITRAGYADVTVLVTGTTVTIQMSLTQYPAISMNPRSRVRVQGENVTFCCEAYGNPAISGYEWMKNGVLIDDTKYPDGFNLTLNDVTISDSGEYKCRANSPVGAVYSPSALLTVKSTHAEFCEDAYEERKISLPSNCVQADGTTLYEVGGCAKKTCRGSNNEDGLCGPTKKFGCTTSSEEERTVQCSGYTLRVIVVTGCSCGEYSSVDISVQGQVNGLNTGVALRLGTIYVNGSSVARTTFSGVFSFPLPAGTLSVALTIEDTLFKNLLTTTKVLTFSESMEGAVYQKITLMEAAPPITISSDVENTVSMGNSSGMPAIAEMTIPPNSFVDASGNPYNGVVKASVNIFDPRNLTSISAAPGSFEFTDTEGDTQDLQTFGVVVLDFQDESGKKLNVAGNVTVKLDATLVESTYSGNVTDVKLWGLNTVTGQWEEVGSMVVETSKRRKRQALNYVVGQVPVSAFRAINLDCYRGFRRCYFKTTVTDTNNNPVNGYTVRVIHMTNPGELYGSTSEYVTAVKEMSSDNNYLQYTFCRNDSWGYIQAYENEEVYKPGDSSESGLSSPVRTLLDYETRENPVSIKSNFLSSDNGPFYDWYDWFYATISTSSSQTFQFYKNSSILSKNKIWDIDPQIVSDNTAVAFVLSTEIWEYGPRLWYPNKLPKTLEHFQICMIKIAVNGSTAGLSFLVESKAGQNSGMVGELLGFHEVEVDNGAACIEYKCSGSFPLFKNIVRGVTPSTQTDETKVTITPVGRFCTVSMEGGIQSHRLNLNSSNIGLASHEWFIPDADGDGVYIHETSSKYNTKTLDKVRDTVLKMCKEGKTYPTGAENPSMTTVNPALVFDCL